jgi:predicted nucleic acid-binding protein
VEIVDTVYLVALLNPDDPKHEEAVELLSDLGTSRRVSQAALIELDLLMKSRAFTIEERRNAWLVLTRVIPEEAVELLAPKDFAVAVELHESEGLDYFDALVAAQCVVRNAKPVTTDIAILKTFEREVTSSRLMRS